MTWLLLVPSVLPTVIWCGWIQQILAPSCSWASHNTPWLLRGFSLWWRKIRHDGNRYRESHWLTWRLQTTQNNVTLSSKVIFWAAPSHNTEVWLSPPGLIPLWQTIMQAEATLSFHDFFSKLLQVSLSPSVWLSSVWNTQMKHSCVFFLFGLA